MKCILIKRKIRRYNRNILLQIKTKWEENVNDVKVVLYMVFIPNTLLNTWMALVMDAFRPMTTPLSIFAS